MARQLDEFEVRMARQKKAAEIRDGRKKRQEFINKWAAAAGDPEKQAKILWELMKKKADLSHEHRSGLVGHY